MTDDAKPGPLRTADICAAWAEGAETGRAEERAEVLALLDAEIERFRLNRNGVEVLRGFRDKLLLKAGRP